MSEKAFGLPVIPDRYRRMHSMPDDPPSSCAYGLETDAARCFVMVYPIPAEQAMPFERPESVVQGIHAVLREDQGLIAVESGKTQAGLDYIYSIVKTVRRPGGVQYCLTMHLRCGRSAAQVQGFFDELGVTGVRDAVVFARAQSEGLVEATEEGIKGWDADPCDPGYTRGCLMNLSEHQKFDALFSRHPLSEARQLAAALINNN